MLPVNMDPVEILLYVAGASGLFASRAFLPAFITSLCIRYGDQVPILRNFDFVQITGSEPTWFTHDIAITTLGILSLIELSGDKIPESKVLLSEVTRYAKPIMAALSTLGYLNAQDASFIEGSIKQSGIGDMLPAALSGGAVYYINNSKQDFLSSLVEADEDDEFGIQGVISWIEDLWASCGPLLFFALPSLIGVVSIVGILIVIRMGRKARREEEASRVECSSCQTLIHRSACTCYNCNKKLTPLHIGFWGTSLEGQVVSDVTEHRLDLLNKKRCSSCASFLEKRSPSQQCGTCNKVAFSPEEKDLFLTRIACRVPLAIIIIFLVGTIPLVGLIFGLVYSRILLVAPFRRYIGLHRSFFARWFLRFIFLILGLLQLVPVAGGISIAVMALMAYRVYRRQFLNSF